MIESALTKARAQASNYDEGHYTLSNGLIEKISVSASSKARARARVDQISRIDNDNKGCNHLVFVYPFSFVLILISLFFLTAVKNHLDMGKIPGKKYNVYQ